MSNKSLVSGVSILGLVVALLLPAQPVASSELTASGDFAVASQSIQFSVTNASTNTALLQYGFIGFRHMGGTVEATPNAQGITTASGLTDGRYAFEIWPSAYGTGLVRTFYTVELDGGTISVTDSNNTEVLPVGGVYPFVLYPGNVVLNVKNPNGSDFVESEEKWLDVELQRRDNSEWIQLEWLRAEGDEVRARILTPGTYRMRVNAIGDPNAAQVVKEFQILDGQVPSGSSPLNLGSVNLNVPNFKFRASFDGSIRGGLQFGIRTADNHQFEWLQSASSSDPAVNGIGTYYFDTPGSYVLRIETWNVAGAAPTSFDVTVSQNLTVTIAGQTATNGIYDLELVEPNLVINPRGINPNNDNSTALQTLDRAYVSVRTLGDQSTEVTNASISDGTISLAVPTGSYVLEVFPNADNYRLLNTKFSLSVDANGVARIQDWYNNDVINAVDGVFNLDVKQANIIGRVVDGEGTVLGRNYSQNQRVSLSLEKNVGGNWEWVDTWAEANELGQFGFFLADEGSYRIRIEPVGFSGLSFTKLALDALNLTSSELLSTTDLGDLEVSSSNLSIKVTRSSGAAVSGAGVEIRQGNDFIEWLNTDSQGRIDLSLEPGNYELVVHPQWGSGGDTTRKQYNLVVDQNLIATISGVNQENGVFVLALGAPNLRGTVLSPSGASAIFEAEVVAVNEETGEELWEYSARTGTDGSWGMNLPAGTYRVYAKSPWGKVDYGSGLKSPVFVVAENGSITSTNPAFSASALELRLSNPTFSGYVYEPGTQTPLRNAQVCLIRGDGDYNWNCSQTNSEGRWALSKPDGFVDFASDSELVISESYGERRFAEKRLSGTEVEAALTNNSGYTDGQTYSNIVLSPASPNLEVTVLAGNNPTARVWVSVDVDGYGWIGSGETNSLGVAKLFVPNDLLSGAINVHANVDNNSNLTGLFASTRVAFNSLGSTQSSRALTVNLSQPNFSGVVYEPSGSIPVRNAWIEAFDMDSGEWVGGASSNSSGNFSITLPKPETVTKLYRLQVNPAWNSSSDYSKQMYVVSVPANDPISDVKKDSISGNVVTAVNNRFPLRLASPSVLGQVRDATGPVRDSWVVPIDNSRPSNPDYLWESGTNTRSNGDFSMALPDGSYLLEANPPWNKSGSSKSARCNLTVTNAVLSNIDPACWDEGSQKVLLNLRSPNLKFKLVDPVGNPVRFANVGAGAGAWHTWTQSDSQGWVSLFVDAEEIVTLNPQLTNGQSIDVSFWFDPPYGNGDIVRWECSSGDQSKPVCKDVPDVTKGSEGSYLTNPLVISTPVAFAAPNTKIKVTKPGNISVGAGAWVALFENASGDPANCEAERNWIAGAVTDTTGSASFNLSQSQMSSSNGYCVEVNATWSERQLYAQAIYPAATHLILTTTNFSVVAPNLKLAVLEPTGNKAVRWSWVGIEEVAFNQGTSKYDWVRWVNGAGTDNRGLANLTLKPSKTYRLTAYPGFGSAGSQVSCIVSTDANAVVSLVAGECGSNSLVNDLLTVRLSAGNVTGTVTHSGSTVVSGAIVLAQSAGKTVSTVTDSQGKYYLQLDNAVWTVKVFVVSRPGDPVQLESDTTGQQVTISGPRTLDLSVNVSAN